jgi:hypothetical protein
VASLVLSVLAALGSAPAHAQTTDGYHAIQVFPVVVDTASFAQRLTFRNPYLSARTLTATYYPAEGTAQPGPLVCPALVVQGVSERVLPSLRSLCPDLVPGTAFGTLVVRGQGSDVFAGYSRVSNPAGNGFSVEAFAAHTFTSAVTTVTGLRRLAASGGAPAFQSNCFVGNLAEITPTAVPVTSSVIVSLTQGGVTLGQTSVPVAPGKLVRLLDVFAAVGLASGDFNDVTAMFEGAGEETPGLLSFCTVQDNSSFGADFRIGKQEYGFHAFAGWQDYSLIRSTYSIVTDLNLDGATTSRYFSIPAGATRNAHLLYFRHPDVISCEVRVYGDLAQPHHGLEMRLLAPSSALINDSPNWIVLAGGNNITYFSGLYLGDKTDRGGGANAHYVLEVESNGVNEGADRAYGISCRSGSGHTRGERVLVGAPVTF